MPGINRGPAVKAGIVKKTRRGYVVGCKLMRLHAFGESVLVVAGKQTFCMGGDL